MNEITELCPCGKIDAETNQVMCYKVCCELAHKSHGSVNSPKQLMRSRYTAFTIAMGDYLMNTHHSSTRPVDEKKEIENWAKSVKWSHLEIIESDVKNDTVEFKAYFFNRPFKQNNLDVIHEKSKFIKEDGLWFYLGVD